MAANSGVFEATQVVSPVAWAYQLTGSALDYYFSVPVRMKIAYLQQVSGAGSGGTDSLKCGLVNTTTTDTIITQVPLTANNTPSNTTAVDANKSAILLPGHIYKLNVALNAGTAANVLRYQVTLFAYNAAHLAS